MSTTDAPIDAVAAERTTIAERFEGITDGDYFRDILAVILLSVSLSLPTAVLQDGNTEKSPLFLAAVAISFVALTLPYAARFGLLPARWTVLHTRKVRLALALPFVALYLWHVVQLGFAMDGAPFGIGSAWALGGAGVALAAQARSMELGPVEHDARATASARLIAIVLAGFIVLGYVLAVVRSAQEMAGGFGEVLFIAALVVGGGAIVILPALAVALKATRAWIAFVVGYAIAISAFIYLTAKDSTSLLPKFELLTFADSSAVPPLALHIGVGLFVIPALAAVVSSPAFARSARRSSDVEQRLDLAAIVLRVMALVGAMFALVHFAFVLAVPGSGGFGRFSGFSGQHLAAAIASVVVVAVALVGLRSFNKSPGTSRPAIGIALALSIVLSFVLPALSPFDGRTFGHFMLLLVLPAIGAFALAGNEASRSFFAEASKLRQEPSKGAYEWTEEVLQPGAKSEEVTVIDSSDVVASTGATAATSVHAANEAARGASSSSVPFAVSAATGATQSVANTAIVESPVDESTRRTGEFATVSSPTIGATATQDLADDSVDTVDAAESGSDVASADLQATTVISPINASEDKVERYSTHSAPTEAISRADVEALENPDTGALSLHGYTEEEALNPETPQIVLAKIAEVAPELRPALAKNPSTYPALVDWLAQLGDPDVDAALAKRHA